MKEELTRLMRFNRGLYLQNVEIRAIVYILWAIIFIMGWFLPFMKTEGRFFAGGVGFVCFWLQYMCMIQTQDGDRKRRLMPVRQFFGVGAGPLCLSRFLCMLPYLGILLVMSLVQTVLEIGTWRFDVMLGTDAMFILAFAAASAAAAPVSLWNA